MFSYLCLRTNVECFMVYFHNIRGHMRLLLLHIAVPGYAETRSSANSITLSFLKKVYMHGYGSGLLDCKLVLTNMV